MENIHFDTMAVHSAGHSEVKSKSKVRPIYQTSAFSFSTLDDLEDFFKGKTDYMYTRASNPNQDDFAKGVTLLEGAEDGVVTSSGISAIMVGILSVVKSGDHIVACEDLYGGTYQLLAGELKDLGIETTFVSFTNKKELEQSIRPNTKLLYSESITNPLLRVEDLKSLVEIAKRHDLKTMIDNTFATPYLVQPFFYGIDLIAHSATKYLNGHSDVTAGVVVGKKELITKAKGKMSNLGCNLSPFDSWLASRGLKTFGVRMERHVHNARALAEVLRSTEGIKQVYYPENISEKGNGAIVTIELDESQDIHSFVEALDWVMVVPTLAGVETSISYPVGTSHRAIPTKILQKLGINQNVIRISVGIEDKEDICAVFQKAIRQK